MNSVTRLYSCLFLSLVVLASPARAVDFRSSSWGDSEAQVLEQEAAAATGREEHPSGGFILLYAESIFGQEAEIRYFFDAACKRLVAASINFREPVSEGDFARIMLTFNSVYGASAVESSSSAGYQQTWKDGASIIRFLHFSYGNKPPELEDWPPSSITYRAGDILPDDCLAE